MIAWWLAWAGPTWAGDTLNDWMLRCAGGDDPACVRLLVAGQLEAGCAGIAPEGQKPDGDGRYDDTGAILAQWALRQRCDQGEALSCLALREWPDACWLPSWSACHAAFVADGDGALPFVHRIDYEDDGAFAGFFPDGVPWLLIHGALKIGELPPRPLLDPATAAQATVLDLTVDAEGIRVLLRVRRQDPALAALGAPAAEIVVATYRAGQWTTNALPGPVKGNRDPALMADGGILFPVDIEHTFPSAYQLVRWTPDGAPKRLAESTADWWLAGDWLLTQAAAEDAPIVRTNLATGAVETWPAPHDTSASLAPDGTAWFARAGQVLRWDVGDAAPEPLAVEAHQPYNGAEKAEGEGRVEGVRARDDGGVDVVWEGGRLSDRLDRDGNFRYSGDLGSPSGPIAAWQPGPTLSAWAAQPPPPPWAAAVAPLSLHLPPVDDALRAVFVDRVGAPLYPALVRMVRETPDPSSYAPQLDSSWRATQPDGSIALVADLWATLAAGDVISASVRRADGFRREFSFPYAPRADGDIVATMLNPELVLPDTEGTVILFTPNGSESSLTPRRTVTRTSGLVPQPGDFLLFVNVRAAFRADTWMTDPAGAVITPAWTALPGRQVRVVDVHGAPVPFAPARMVAGSMGRGPSFVTKTNAAGLVTLPPKRPAQTRGPTVDVQIGIHTVPAAAVEGGLVEVVYPLPTGLDLAATPMGATLLDRYVGTWQATWPVTASSFVKGPAVWVVKRAGEGLAVTRNNQPMRVVGSVGADLWVAAAGAGPVDNFRLRPAGDEGLWVATDEREPSWVLLRPAERSE